jgi:DNA transformation protein
VKEDSFKDFVFDQLSAMPGLRAKAMFGGHGFCAGEKFFGILMDGRLYFKIDEHTRPLYEQRGMGPFLYEKARQTMTMRYYEVPPEILENRTELIDWAKRAVQAADARPTKPRRPSIRPSTSSVQKNPGERFRRDE